MTGYGKIDSGKDEIDFVVAVRPLPDRHGLESDSAVRHGHRGNQNSFLVASFNIKGPMEDPIIIPAL
jgi:hypothetical protein